MTQKPVLPYLVGDTVDVQYLNPSSTTAIEAGQVVLLGADVLVCKQYLPASRQGVLQTGGIKKFPKAVGVTFSAGDAVYWDPTGTPVSATTAQTAAGAATSVAGSYLIGTVVPGEHAAAGAVANDTAAGDEYVPVRIKTTTNISTVGGAITGVTSMLGGDSSLGITGKAGSSGAGGDVALTGGAGDSGAGGVVTGTGGAGSSAAGGAVTFTGGAGNGAYAGGAANLVGGAGGSGGAGGAVAVTGGAGTGAASGGAVAIAGGAAGATSGTGGAASVMGGGYGAGTNYTGGAASVTGGAGKGSGNGGAASLVGGAGGATGTGGAISIVSGASAGAGGTAGAVSIDTGAATGGTGAGITIGGTNATSITLGKMPRIPVNANVAVGGTAINNANAVSEGVTVVTGADNSAAVLLPVGVAGESVELISTTASKKLVVFPQANAAIDNLGVNNSYTSATTAPKLIFRAKTATQWYCMSDLAG